VISADVGGEGAWLPDSGREGRRVLLRSGTGLVDQLAARQRAAAAGKAVVPAVVGRDGMAADRQAGRAEGGGGYVARGTDAYRTAGVAAVDLELDRPGWGAGAGVADADGGGEGERLPE